MADQTTCFLILCFLALLLMSSLSTDAKILNITTDQSALLALKAHISYDPHHILTTNWSSNTSVCNWVGVTCGSRHQRVTALNLSNYGLVGTIPPHIGNLSFLVSLRIKHNRFHGSMPNELSHLYRLEILHFGYNEFSGEIPSWIGLLTKLQSLILVTNNFEGSIPSSLFNRTSSLQQIVLEDNQLWGSIPSSIFKIMSTLEVISLAENKFSGPMPSILFNMSSLQYIDLSNNMLSGTLPPEVGNLIMLTDLNLANNSFEGSQLPSSLFKCKQLQYLNLWSNNLKGKLSPEIGNLTKLTVLNLDHNNFEGSLPSSLFKCKQLQGLYLKSNNFTGKLSPEIGNLSKLIELDLSYNNFEGAIPSEIGNLQSLEYFNLGLNNFVGTIPPDICNISTIQVFAILENCLSGTLPSDMGLFLPNLKHILIEGNVLSGIIPASISNASQLITVDLAKNSFSGLIPKTLGKLRLLEWLGLEFNNLTIDSSENIFSYFSNNAYLKALILNMNPLNAVLPNSIGNHSIFLEILHFTSCNMKGNIPIDIGNLSRLTYLSLADNDLTGPIPATIGRLSMLERLVLFGNRLKGSIPSDICYLGKLGILDLADNKLSRQIPESISNMTSLRLLSLPFNQLTSKIPSSLWSQTNLLMVDLSSNSLSGSLSLDIGNMKVLTALNLSRNQLSGSIPETISGLISLVNLSLAVNQLEGPIPISFGGLVSLELLDLVGNNLSGEIPKSLEMLRYLKYLNVSYNKLQGEIPTQGPFVNFSAESFMSNDALCGVIRLNVPPCKEASLGQRKAMGLMILKYVLPTLGSMILVVSIVLVSRKLQAKKNAKLSNNKDSIPLSTWRRISHQKLLQATEGFSANNLLGEGSFGSVYKGTLLDGTYVAIKVLNLELEGAFKSFDIECEILRHVRHRNLVKIISVCSNIDFKALVLEYMSKGNLEMWLYSNTHCLNMLQRLNIMIDVAAALEYLHLGYSTPIVHCDLKPSNVLLDEDMVGHVADFGISKLLSDGISLTQTMTMATIGYMAPEYGSEGIISTSGDVYSYGILLMETFTRKKPTDDMTIGQMSLKHLVEESFSISILEVIDANLLSNENDYAAMETCLSETMGLALHCCADLPKQRIDIQNVLARLKKIKLKYLHDHGGG
ncbi:putative receptor-like protein kinase At3g47110 isoform X1 [Carya illinoinensis]|nr:putative receptor-like protein kinase At3g47110 isoform X1 [Carya illinoinensis]XP_042944260.1 putative receptor-like protein kinase At3g47110 isoform X1 [Carya illinoinensis]XP_042944261.1 putative receptor-like protein kinase At3g47110 isoform X1 [Carya illinoinensis]XP_042944262.1 putative receptor-like protein kinase At3g47110 isoform X1 [Carya illinoinensis]XP_042944264.1 putative receptor-like protein kinase At3g47110 isoform X1 [Carya illinoinensis]XP_042944265.1 putative receptor-li